MYVTADTKKQNKLKERGFIMANFQVIKTSNPKEDGAVFRYWFTIKTDRGIQCKVILPAAKTLQGYHFISFYTGLGDFECGI